MNMVLSTSTMREYEKTGKAFVKEYIWSKSCILRIWNAIYVGIIREYEKRGTVFIERMWSKTYYIWYTMIYIQYVNIVREYEKARVVFIKQDVK
jgi:hypothetical protein